MYVYHMDIVCAQQLSKTESKACYISGIQNAIDAVSIPLETAFTQQHVLHSMVVRPDDAAPASTSSLFQKAVNLNVVAVLLMSVQHDLGGQAEQD